MRRYSSTTTGRTFEDALRVVDRITRCQLQRCPNNMEMTKLLLDRLNLYPVLKKIRFVHVAGTKGKGTTSTYTAALLQSYGFKVGLFTSPHLLDIRERTLVNNCMLPKEGYAKYFFEMLDRYDKLTASESQLDRELASAANFFRFMFLLSLHIFCEESVDVAVVEVGVGGRLDATNTILPEVSIITSLGLDHVEILGSTVEEIAAEKAGIMKPGVICYAAPQEDHPSTRKVLQAHGRKTGAPVVFVDEQTLPIRNWPRLAIGGKHAIEDSKLALLGARRIAGIPPTAPLDEVERGTLQTMTLMGRSQILSIGDGSDATFYLDGAHTPESLSSATTWFIDASSNVRGDPNPRRVLLLYCSRDPATILKSFMPFVQYFSKVIIACVRSPQAVKKHPDMDDDDQARQVVVAITEGWRKLYQEVPCLPCSNSFHSIEEIMNLAVPALENTGEDASKPAQIFVTGSFYLVGDVIKLIKDYKLN